MIRIKLSLTGQGPVARTERAGRAWAKATTVAIAGATEGAKLALRKQLDARGGRMKRLRGAIRGDVHPRPPRYSPDAAGTIYAAGDAAERMFSAFSAGPVVTPRKGKALAIPLHNYRDIRGTLLGPRSSFFAGRLEYIPRRHLDTHGPAVIGIFAMRASGRPSQIRRQRNTPGRKGLSDQIDAGLVPVFVLVSSARLPKLLSPETIIAEWTGRIPDMIQAALREFE